MSKLHDEPNRYLREASEAISLFKDPKFARQAWKSIAAAILRNPATKPPKLYDKNGNETLESLIQGYTYTQLTRDIANLTSPNREPTELEMIMAGQILKARWDTAAATFVRDTCGAKPVDETKIDGTMTNVFESLTDEELEMLKDFRDSKRKQEAEQAALQSLANGEPFPIRPDDEDKGHLPLGIYNHREGEIDQ